METFMKAKRMLLLAVLVIAAGASPVLAGPPLPGVPEIDPGSMMSALTLLIGGALMLTDRFRRK
jgi:hypothetical protein